MNLTENDTIILLDALECKMYDTKEQISKYKKLENPGIMLEHYQVELQEIETLFIKLSNQ